MKKALLVLSLAAFALAVNAGDNKDKKACEKDKKACCAKKEGKACAGETKACCKKDAKGEKSCCKKGGEAKKEEKKAE